MDETNKEKENFQNLSSNPKKHKNFENNHDMNSKKRKLEMEKKEQEDDKDENFELNLPQTQEKPKESEILQFIKSLKLSSFDYLNSLNRQICPGCNHKRKYFCYLCYSIMGPHPELVPKIKLPIKLDILHHPKELPSKSTAIHAKLLAPDETTIYEFPEITDYKNRDDVLLLFPSKDSNNVHEIDISKIKRLVVIDCTWNQTKYFFREGQLDGVSCVKLNDKKTYFWRYQSEGEHCLSTIEAIYYFFCEYDAKINGVYDGKYDNLLYFYIFYYQLIQSSYKDGDKKDKEFRRKSDYIHYNQF